MLDSGEVKVIQEAKFNTFWVNLHTKYFFENLLK